VSCTIIVQLINHIFSGESDERKREREREREREGERERSRWKWKFKGVKRNPSRVAGK
jgi:hypothetical protein